MIRSKLAKKLRRLAKEIEEPLPLPSFDVRVTIIQYEEDPVAHEMRPVVTAWVVLVSSGSVMEAELPHLPMGGRIQLQAAQR